jgi:hypothetical protein
VIDVRLLPGIAARLEEATSDCFADPLDPAGEEYQTRDARHQSAHLDTGALAVAVPELRTPQHDDPRGAGQQRVKPSRLLIVVPAGRCCHDNTPTGYRTRSPAAAAGEPGNSEKLRCPRSRVW